MKEYCEHYTLDCQAEKMTCEGCAYNKKSADELFKKLGFEKKYQLDAYDKIWGQLFYNKKSMVNISFGYEGHLVCAYITTNDNQEQPAYATMQELQAINKKVEELGWK